MENGDLLGGAFKKAESTIRDDKESVKMKKELKEKSKMTRD
jgi:hypothetical protein